MNYNLAIVILFVSVTIFGWAGAAGCRTKQSNFNKPATVSERKGAPRDDETVKPRRDAQRNMSDIETLQGARFSIADPFVAIVRDAETYKTLRELSQNTLPDFGGDYFKTHAVVAAFLGQKRTGGFSVQISNADAVSSNAERNLVVKVNAPARGAMVAQVITAPFQAASVGVNENQELRLALDESFIAAARPYEISSGDFASGGGIAGRRAQFQLAGALRVMRQGNLVTILFDLKGTHSADSASGTSSPQNVALNAIATGTVNASGVITLPRIEHGSLVQSPASPLKAVGEFGANEDTLALTFSSLPATVADGFSGAGKLEAKATAPPRPKRQAID